MKFSNIYLNDGIIQPETIYEAVKSHDFLKLPKHMRQSAQEAYDTGYKAVIEKTENALKIYEKIMENFNDYGSRAYYETIFLGMPAFFKCYDPLFEPQNHILSLDYPLEEHLQIEVWKQKGIDRIYDYLLAIAEEQKFLANYPEESIRDRLKKYHFLGGELFINVKKVFTGGK